MCSLILLAQLATFLQAKALINVWQTPQCVLYNTSFHIGQELCANPSEEYFIYDCGGQDATTTSTLLSNALESVNVHLYTNFSANGIDEFSAYHYSACSNSTEISWHEEISHLHTEGSSNTVIQFEQNETGWAVSVVSYKAPNIVYHYCYIDERGPIQFEDIDQGAPFYLMISSNSTYDCSAFLVPYAYHVTAEASLLK